MKESSIEIIWEGPLTVEQVINLKNDAGRSPHWEGEDYGLYQIYAEHILSRSDTLVYVGKAVEQTFAQRFRQHAKDWLKNEKDVQIFLGRINGPRYSRDDLWQSWKDDVGMAEKILIYKYTPNYNSSEKGDYPKLKLFQRVKLTSQGNRHRLHRIDIAPDDYK